MAVDRDSCVDVPILARYVEEVGVLRPGVGAYETVADVEGREDGRARRGTGRRVQ